MATRTIRNGKVELSVEVDDVSLPWRRDRAPILLQHGFGRSSAIWTTWAPHLCAQYRLIRPDLRGLRTPIPGFDAATDITLDAYLGDLCRILDGLGVDAVHYCGESFGGSMGIGFAARHPDRVRSLSVVASPLYTSAKWREAYALGHASWSAAMEKMGVEAWLEKTNSSTRFPPSMGAAFLSWYNGQILGADPAVLVAMARLIENADMRPYLDKVRAPLLMMAPAGGGIITPEQLDAYRAGAARLTLLQFHTAYHKIQLLHARECAGHVAHFCAQADGIALLDM